MTKEVQIFSKKETSCTVLNRCMCTCSVYTLSHTYTHTDKISKSTQLTFLVNSPYLQEKKSKSLRLVFSHLTLASASKSSLISHSVPSSSHAQANPKHHIFDIYPFYFIFIFFIIVIFGHTCGIQKFLGQCSYPTSQQ